MHENGTTRKTVVKDVYAKLTTRNTLTNIDPNRNKNTEDTSHENLSDNGLQKRAQKINNILKHISSHDTRTQAMIVAIVVDQNGSEYASEVVKNSREIQGQLKLTPYDTASMTAGMGITDSAAIKMRTAMNKRKGWNMLASHRQVKKIRVSQLPFGKESYI